jgi:hypothetical protein
MYHSRLTHTAARDLNMNEVAKLGSYNPPPPFTGISILMPSPPTDTTQLPLSLLGHKEVCRILPAAIRQTPLQFVWIQFNLVNIVTRMTIATQRLGKHIPQVSPNIHC